MPALTSSISTRRSIPTPITTSSSAKSPARPARPNSTPLPTVGAGPTPPRLTTSSLTPLPVKALARQGLPENPVAHHRRLARQHGARRCAAADESLCQSPARSQVVQAGLPEVGRRHEG